MGVLLWPSNSCSCTSHTFCEFQDRLYDLKACHTSQHLPCLSSCQWSLQTNWLPSSTRSSARPRLNHVLSQDEVFAAGICVLRQQEELGARFGSWPVKKTLSVITLTVCCGKTLGCECSHTNLFCIGSEMMVDHHSEEVNNPLRESLTDISSKRSNF